MTSVLIIFAVLVIILVSGCSDGGGKGGEDF